MSDEPLGEPRTDQELYRLLERGGSIDPGLSAVMQRFTGFRNLLVHGYDDVDLTVVRDAVEHRLDDLLEFVAVIRRRLKPAG